MRSFIHEKGSKLINYIRLKYLFSKKNEFKNQHPELCGLWEKKFRQMIRYSSERTFPIVDEFLNVKIEKIKSFESGHDREPDLILICALKNDIDKMHYFMNHYRKLGIHNFVFLDNGSTDGTFEFLLEQNDAEVYRCTHAFTADRKIAWVNRLIAEYGVDRWYLMVDSDEFFIYLGHDKYQFNDLLEIANKKEFKRLGVVHLDMYPKGSLFESGNKENFVEKYCYFDKDTYSYEKTARGMKIAGGPRKRVFGTNMKVSGYRLVYFEKDDVVPSAHFMIPYEKSYGVPVVLISLHYKFVNESDYEKMLEAVKTGMHSNNSEEYRTYFEGISQDPNLTFYDEKHSEVLTENNLRKLEFVDEIFNK